MPLVGVVAADFNDFAALPANMRYSTTGENMAEGWDGTGTIFAVAGGLSYDRGGYAIVQEGSGLSAALQGNYNESRQNIRDLAGVLEGEIWMSFLVNNPDDTALAALSLNPLTNGDPKDGLIANWIGIRGDQLEVSWDSVTTSQLATLPTGETHLLLARLLTNASGDDTLQVWADPADLLALGEPAFVANDLDIIDELYRIGTLSFNWRARPSAPRADISTRSGSAIPATPIATSPPYPSPAHCCCWRRG